MDKYYIIRTIHTIAVIVVLYITHNYGFRRLSFPFFTGSVSSLRTGNSPLSRQLQVAACRPGFNV